MQGAPGLAVFETGTGIYAETNLIANRIVGISQKLAAGLGHAPDDFVIEWLDTCLGGGYGGLLRSLRTRVSSVVPNENPRPEGQEKRLGPAPESAPSGGIGELLPK